MSRRVFIIDTNVVVSALITADPQANVCRILDAMLTGEVPFLLSPALLAEYRQVMLRPKLIARHRLMKAEIDDLLETLVLNAIWREPSGAATAPDPGDDNLWRLLASTPNGALVTGDQLLAANPPDVGTVMLPAAFREAHLLN